MIGTDYSNFMRNNAFKVHSFREEKGMTGIVGISGKVRGFWSSLSIIELVGTSAEGRG